MSDDLKEVKTDKKEKKTAVQKAKDEGVPLSDIHAEQDTMSWWWILVIAIFGAAGYEMYRRYNARKVNVEGRDNIAEDF